MESLVVYQQSLAELDQVARRMSYDSITINMSKLDGVTREAIVNSLSSVIARRKNEITSTLEGVR